MGNFKDTMRELWQNVREAADALFTRQFVVRKRHGGEVMAMPMILGILLILLAAKFVLIIVIVALIAGYRFSIDRR